MLKRRLVMYSTFSISFVLIACGNDSDRDYEVCIQKGVQYYKDIDSYPRLKSENISADDKIQQICKNNVTAFN